MIFQGLAVNLDTFDVLVADSRDNRLEPAALYRLPCTNIGTYPSALKHRLIVRVA